MPVQRIKKRKNSRVVETLSWKKPTGLDKIIEKIPKPEGAVPNFGLPKWKLWPLEAKIPMIPAPEDAYILSRQKLGKKIWVQSKNAQFDLSDPYNYRIEYSYDSMHDQHLTRYFARENNIKHLLNSGLISKDLDAFCSLKDYNMYRKFLKQVYNDSINEELERQYNLKMEIRTLGFADMAAKKEIERLKKEEHQKLERKRVEEESKVEKEIMAKVRKTRGRKMTEVLKAMGEAKEEKKKEQILKCRSRAEQARRKRAQLLKLTQDQIIRNVVERARKQVNAKRAQKKRKAEKAKEKRRAIEEKWQRKIEEEEIDIARKQSALRRVQKEREKFIKIYESKAKRGRAKFQKRVKNYAKYLSCYLARKVADPGENTCCKIPSNRQEEKADKDAEKLSSPQPESTSDIFEVKSTFQHN